MNEACLPLHDLRSGVQAIAGDPPRLVAGRCTSCRFLSFPAREVCPECSSGEIDDEPIGPLGTLYSMTTVFVSATRTVPYSLGYVDFPEGPRVLALLSADPQTYALDGHVRLRVTADGAWSVVPDESGASS